MLGPLHASEPTSPEDTSSIGIIPRALADYIATKRSLDLSLSLCAIEIFRNQVHDLITWDVLDSVGIHKKRCFYKETNVLAIHCRSRVCKQRFGSSEVHKVYFAEQSSVLALLRTALPARRSCSESGYARSKSHLIVMINIQARQERKQSSMLFVDLAGSEVCGVFPCSD